MKKRIIAIVLIILILLGVYFGNEYIRNKNKVKQTTEEIIESNEDIITVEKKEEVVEEPKNTNSNTTSNTKKKTTTKKKTAKKTTTTTTKKVSYNKSELKQYAHDLVISYGWSEYDYECLVKLWNRESGWNPNAVNKKSLACGIPQSLPCSKMKSEGSDYKTNGKTQIRWGLKYIKNRYGSPSKAWEHSQKKGWY